MGEKKSQSSASPRKGKPAPKGNKYGTKLKEPEVRQQAYRQYCKHIASGKDIRSFHFDHPEHSVCWETMQRYIKENPTEFDAFLLRSAKAKRYEHWMEHGLELMKGKYKHGSPTVWQTIMRNMFKDIGWESEDRRSDPESDEKLKALAQFFAKVTS